MDPTMINKSNKMNIYGLIIVHIYVMRKRKYIDKNTSSNNNLNKVNLLVVYFKIVNWTIDPKPLVQEIYNE